MNLLHEAEHAVKIPAGKREWNEIQKLYKENEAVLAPHFKDLNILYFKLTKEKWGRYIQEIEVLLNVIKGECVWVDVPLANHKGEYATHLLPTTKKGFKADYKLQFTRSGTAHTLVVYKDSKIKKYKL